MNVDFEDEIVKLDSQETNVIRRNLSNCSKPCKIK